ncbi:MAG: radical SAM protein [candidate division WOR-3 bacterium]
MSEFEEVSRVYPFKVTDWVLALIKEFSFSDPIVAQFFPRKEELTGGGELDPFLEEGTTESSCLVRRYIDRLLVITTNLCFVHCRFCMRKRNWLKEEFIFSDLGKLENYLRSHPEIRDVIISGGDPIVLDDILLGEYLFLLRKLNIPIVRIGTRAPIVNPSMVFSKLSVFKKFAPLWLVVHVNHPVEVESEDVKTLFLELLRSGVVLSSQTVLLRGVNDSETVLEELFFRLVTLGVRPYYLFNVDPVVGADHFRVPLNEALTIVNNLRKRLSGLMIPHFAIDTKDGKKIVP